MDEAVRAVERHVSTVGEARVRPGACVLHYRVLRALGDGGMGQVFEAEDLRLGRLVALKFPLREDAGPELCAQVAREARAAAALQHPNVATVHALEEVDGRLFLVMERVEGESLAARLAAGPLAPGELRDVGRQAALGLAAAHAAGVVHKDVKPSNLLFGRGGSVKVIDFGLASLAGPADRTRTTVTADAQSGPEEGSGAIAGSVPYMSPEQVRGEPLDPATDVFSLGVTLYEAATGTRPFDRATPVLTAHALAYEAHEPLARARPEVPVAVARLVERALAKDRRQRPAMGELADGLAGAAATPLRRGGAGSVAPSRRWALLVGALLLGSAGLGLLVVPGWRAPAPRPSAAAADEAPPSAAEQPPPPRSGPGPSAPNRPVAPEPPTQTPPDTPAPASGGASVLRAKVPVPPAQARAVFDPWLLATARACLAKPTAGPASVRVELSDGRARSVLVTGELTPAERRCIVLKSEQHAFPRDAVAVRVDL